MMSNDSAGAATPIKQTVLVFGAVGYVVLGAPTAVLNGLIALSIAKYWALRECKEFIVLMALAAADVLNLTAYISAGVYRLAVLFWSDPSLLSTLECLSKPHVWLWSVTYPLSSLMLVIVSIDRVLLVALRETYIFSFGRRYAWTLVGVPYLFCTLFALSNLSAALIYAPNHPWLKSYCRPIESFSSPTLLFFLFRNWYEYSYSVFPFLSVILFLAVGPVYRYNRNKTHNLSSAGAQEKLDRQHRMTRTIAVSCMCTVLLAVVPGRLAFVFWNKGMFVLAYCCWHLMLTNPLANAAVYQLRHHDLRTGLVSMLRGKDMPDNLDLWPQD